MVIIDIIQLGDCVQIPDGRIGRVWDKHGGAWIVRVRRKTSKSHQLLFFQRNELKVVACPKGWMSPEGYNRYLEITLVKMRQRNREESIVGVHGTNISVMNIT